MAASADTWVPLKPTLLHILLALAKGPKHGYAIRAHTDAQSDGRVKLWPVTLYGSLRNLEEGSLIAGLAGDEDPDDDGRRRYYELTSLGREVLDAEAERLQVLVDAARAASALSRA